MQTLSRVICGTTVSLRRLEVDGRVWLNMREFAAIIGFSAVQVSKMARDHSPEDIRPLRQLMPGSTAPDLYLSTEAIRFLAEKIRQPRDFADELTIWFAEEVMPEPPEPPPPPPPPAPPPPAPPPPDEPPSKMQRLTFLKTCKEAADAWGLPIDQRMRTEVQQLLASALLPEGEHDSEYVDAADLLRERGYNEAQVSRLAGELGKDLKLATGASTHEAAARFGADTEKNIRRYHRKKDARVIETVLANFMNRDLHHRVMGSVARLCPVITQRLQEQGRGRRATPSAILF